MTADQPPQAEPQTQRNPLIELVQNLTPDTSAKLKAILLPPQTGLIYVIGPLAFKIGYINTGKMQFNSEFYGLLLPNKQGIMRPGGHIEPPQETRAANPAPHEIGRNPNNVTLNVQSGAIDATSIFGKRQANGQNPVA
jgi:hypothetical protein